MVIVLPEDATAADLMKTDPVTTTPDKTVNDARWLFRTHRIGGLPVLENGKLVGLFTLADLKKARRGTVRLGRLSVHWRPKSVRDNDMISPPVKKADYPA